MKKYAILAVTLLVAVASPSASSEPPADICGQPSVVDERMGGVVEDKPRLEPYHAEKQIEFVCSTGANVLQMVVTWVPGQDDMSKKDRVDLEIAVRAAQAQGLQVCLAFWPVTWTKEKYQPPLTLRHQKNFAHLVGRVASFFESEDPVRCWIIGTEPNSPRFYPKQFVDGVNVAVQAYGRLLARSYDVLKGNSADNIVIGGNLASHGNNKQRGKGRKSQSPDFFIEALGRVYRDSGRTRPIMDVFGYHPYPLNSGESPDTQHTPGSKMLGIADYEQLVEALGKAFDGTEQPGSSLPICYCEYGIQSKIPAEKHEWYEGEEPKATRAVSETVQASYYRQYFELAACQPNVIAAFIFKVFDEDRLRGWQSGVRYVSGAAKSSLPKVRQVILKFRQGLAQLECG